MWQLEKEVVISSAHHLLNYEGKCAQNHGHNFKIIVYCQGEALDNVGMLVDFVEIKKIIMKYDHRDLNELMPNNPTAENLAKHLYNQIPHCYKIMVEECDGSRIYYSER